HTFPGHRSGPLAVAFDGQTVLTAGRSRRNWLTTEPGPAKSDSSLRRWNLATCVETAAYPIPLRGWCLFSTFSSDGKRFACADEDGKLLVFDTATGKEVSQAMLPKREVRRQSGDKVEIHSFLELDELRFSADNKLLLATGRTAILY